ncbi:MAG: MGMT family protein [Clostridia bacterium]|nr:MGMT family protein [Clostridia bacterium]
MGTVFERIYEIVKKIPEGRVATYGQIAFAAGNPRWARAVGYALHVNPDPATIKCHRVVNREGRISPAFAFGGENMQRQLLLSEGVAVSEDGFVDLKKYLVDTFLLTQ